MDEDIPFFLKPIEDVQTIKGKLFPAHLSFRQLLITGPPGAGKSTMIVKLGGWSEEGYIDLSLNKWWSAQSLSLRPREIHLGFPIAGLTEVHAVFDEEWLAHDQRNKVDFERIVLPPEKKYFFSVDWHNRYVFEFVLPGAEQLFEQRIKRAKKRTHHVDANLTRSTVEDQLDVYRQVAMYLNQHGIYTYVREGSDGVPMQLIESH
ncbi:MAG: serine/threonine protein phosphatase [Gammaproteobacteria bacterium]|nr:serine/threonine protein phosphatase [Gammaproteobacteria bacterium]